MAVASLSAQRPQLTAHRHTDPFDSIKTKLQVQTNPPQYSSTLDAFIKVARSSGWRGFYRGFIPVASGSVPANMAYFNAFELGKRLGFSEVAVGAMAQATGSIIFTPVDVLKERMQVQGMRGINSSSDGPYRVFADLVRERGYLGLMRGYWMTNLVWIPWNMVYVPLYESSKRQCRKLSVDRERDLHPMVLITCSAICASLAAVVTHPIDIIKTNYQVTKEDRSKGGSISSITMDLWRREGFRALTRGLSARILTLAPGTAISWAVYEPLQRALSS